MSEGKRFCWHCDEPITSGQVVVTAAKVSISGGGRTVELHERCPKRPVYVRRTQA